MTLGIDTQVADEDVRRRAADHLNERGVRLPTIAQLADPAQIPQSIQSRLSGVDPDEPDSLNLFRLHWFNGADRKSLATVPQHVVLPESVTGVPSPIIVVLGDRFPLIGAHKVLAAYACLVSRLVTGRFDPTTQRAVWPSTGNYCRGGVAISRILGCRGLAVLPGEMSEERFRWLEEWVVDAGDIIRTEGSESNIREIYDRCRELDAARENVVFNQFSEFGNHLAHVLCTGPALEAVFLKQRELNGDLSLAAFVSATGSAGTIGAGDYLKERFDSSTVAAEPLECPTMLNNGYGEHHIQGIGDRHVPLIHNVMNTDFVVGVSDRSTDCLNVLFNSEDGREILAGGLLPDEEFLGAVAHFGLSTLCNIVASIKISRQLRLDASQALITVATDGASMYATEIARARASYFTSGLNRNRVEEVLDACLWAPGDEDILKLEARDRERIFNLGYFTWVEQQGITTADFDSRRSQSFWMGLRSRVAELDQRIEEFNREARQVD